MELSRPLTRVSRPLMSAMIRLYQTCYSHATPKLLLPKFTKQAPHRLSLYALQAVGSRLISVYSLLFVPRQADLTREVAAGCIGVATGYQHHITLNVHLYHLNGGSHICLFHCLYCLKLIALFFKDRNYRNYQKYTIHRGKSFLILLRPYVRSRCTDHEWAEQRADHSGCKRLPCPALHFQRH